MCTATIVKPTKSSALHAGFRHAGSWLMRIVFNRDESRHRPPATPPEYRDYKGCTCMMPIDPVSDGTWIAANQHGVIIFLLNHYPRAMSTEDSATNHPQETTSISRGTISPQLIHAKSVEQAYWILNDFEVSEYASFRLVAVDARTLLEYTHGEGNPAIHRDDNPAFPRLYVSSGLGDILVEGPRRDLFEETFREDDDPIVLQRRFQRHAWPNAPHLSVCMRRQDARTVSQTIVDLHSDGVDMFYRPDAPDQEAPLHELSLPSAGTAA